MIILLTPEATLLFGILVGANKDHEPLVDACDRLLERR